MSTIKTNKYTLQVDTIAEMNVIRIWENVTKKLVLLSNLEKIIATCQEKHANELGFDYKQYKYGEER